MHFHKQMLHSVSLDFLLKFEYVKTFYRMQLLHSSNVLVEIRLCSDTVGVHAFRIITVVWTKYLHAPWNDGRHCSNMFCGYNINSANLQDSIRINLAEQLHTEVYIKILTKISLCITNFSNLPYKMRLIKVISLQG